MQSTLQEIGKCGQLELKIPMYAKTDEQKQANATVTVSEHLICKFTNDVKVFISAL